jgi:hypothetical protein
MAGGGARGAGAAGCALPTARARALRPRRAAGGPSRGPGQHLVSLRVLTVCVPPPRPFLPPQYLPKWMSE